MPIEMQSREEQDKVEDVMQLFKELSGGRQNFEEHWNDVAHYVWPETRNTFKPQDTQMELPGTKKTIRQLDSTPQIALEQFSSIMDSLLTPRNSIWHKLRTDDEDLNRDRDVALWFQKLNRQLFKERYAPGTNFAAQNQLHYTSLGAYGTGVMFVDAQEDGRGLRYKSVPLGQAYIRENHQGVINTVLRYFSLHGYQVRQAYTKEEIGEEFWEETIKRSDKLYAFIHVVMPNKDLDPTRQDAAGKPFASHTVSVDKKWLVREGGFTSFPYPSSRYKQAPNEQYGRSPAMQSLPAIKTLQSQKSVVLKQGHRTADPVLLTHDDGILDNVDLTPGAVNPGGVTANGQPLVQTLPVGNVQVGLEMMDQERALINAAFLVHLFEILNENPRMTATEVLERTREKGILLAPTVGRQQDEYMGPLIDREIDVLVNQGLIDPMPGPLLEARGEYTVTYDNPISRAMRAEEAAGMVRVLDNLLPVIQVTGDPSALDNFNMDVALRELSDIQAVPRTWMRTPEEVEEIREGRAQQAEEEKEIAAAPGAAALMNAETNRAKA